MAVERAVLVTRKTRLESLVERFNTAAQARFYIQNAGGDFGEYEREHDAYRRSLDAVKLKLRDELKYTEIDRSFVPGYLFEGTGVVVTVGQDGLVANTAKYLRGIPIIAVNPDPGRYDGILLPFSPDGFPPALRSVMEGRAPLRHITLAEAVLGDGQRLLAFNDFFIGPRSHISARYRISHGGRSETQSSSGIIVSTGAGSTGWLSSLFNMARGIEAAFTGTASLDGRVMAWDEERLIFVVREPFISRGSSADITAGEITPEAVLEVESTMPSEGTIFSDGVEADFLKFNAGAVLRVSVAAEKAALVWTVEMKQQ
ncbi:MAG TPA: hypothetical protein ENN21_10540 [Spirochaetes bacterium]|nr:hypothetical protein [Spirochaetota bacterium]